LIISVGTRLTDFATGSQSIFENAEYEQARGAQRWFG
jgi:TPP-dependent trihydroxycyclohexane-1,2-dione (THcHDO) dehydratase